MNDQFIPIHEPRPEPTDARVRRAMTWLAVAVLAGAVVTAFFSVLQVIEIWFDYQYVPIARAVLAILVGGVAFLVVRMLTRKQVKPEE